MNILLCTQLTNVLEAIALLGHFPAQNAMLVRILTLWELLPTHVLRVDLENTPEKASRHALAVHLDNIKLLLDKAPVVLVVGGLIHKFLEALHAFPVQLESTALKTLLAAPSALTTYTLVLKVKHLVL